MSLGFFLLEDLGDITFWSALQGADVDAFTAAHLLNWGICRRLMPPAVLPTYDDVELQRELDVCPDWFCARTH